MDRPGPSGSKRNSSATDLHHSRKPWIGINEFNPNYTRVIESWIVDEDSSGSEVDDVGEDFCQSKLKRKLTYRCYSCKKHICSQCAKQACPHCA